MRHLFLLVVVTIGCTKNQIASSTAVQAPPEAVATKQLAQSATRPIAPPEKAPAFDANDAYATVKWLHLLINNPELMTGNALARTRKYEQMNKELKSIIGKDIQWRIAITLSGRGGPLKDRVSFYPEYICTPFEYYKTNEYLEGHRRRQNPPSNMFPSTVIFLMAGDKQSSDSSRWNSELGAPYKEWMESLPPNAKMTLCARINDVDTFQSPLGDLTFIKLNIGNIILEEHDIKNTEAKKALKLEDDAKDAKQAEEAKMVANRKDEAKAAKIEKERQENAEKERLKIEKNEKEAADREAAEQKRKSEKLEAERKVTEDKANELLKAANRWLAEGTTSGKDIAITRLKDLLKRFPDSEAAKEGRKLLEKITR